MKGPWNWIWLLSFNAMRFWEGPDLLWSTLRAAVLLVSWISFEKEDRKKDEKCCSKMKTFDQWMVFIVEHQSISFIYIKTLRYSYRSFRRSLFVAKPRLKTSWISSDSRSERQKCKVKIAGDFNWSWRSSRLKFLPVIFLEIAWTVHTGNPTKRRSGPWDVIGRGRTSAKHMGSSIFTGSIASVVMCFCVIPDILFMFDFQKNISQAKAWYLQQKFLREPAHQVMFQSQPSVKGWKWLGAKRN